MTTDKTGAPVGITKESDQYTISLDGRQAGFAQFIDHNGQRIFPHTEVDEEFEGRGLGTILVRAALDDTRESGLRIVPVCPLVAAVIDKNPHYSDVVDPVTAEAERMASERTAS